MAASAYDSTSTASSVLLRYLKPKVLRGNGHFICQDNDFRAKFTLEWYPHDMIITIRGTQVSENQGLFGETRNRWSLDGQLVDGRSIRASLFLTQSTFSLPDVRKTLMSFIPSDSVLIGEVLDSPPSEVRYPLVGYHDDAFRIEDDGWTIKTEATEITRNQAKRLQTGWRLTTEGLALRLSHQDATLEQYSEKARQLMHLLSLASGNGITFHRQIVSWTDETNCEIYRQGIRYEPGPGPCVPSFCIQHFLDQTLPTWRSWKQEKRDICRLIIDYLALSGTGYLDTRLINIGQAWEVIATAWGPETQPSCVEKALKDRLKEVWRNWRREHANADKDAHLWERITRAFHWTTALAKIETFANSRDLNLERIGLDIKELKRSRDSVAHAGKMPQDMNDNRSHALSVLRNAQFGLQLALLVDLGYSDFVENDENGLCTYVKIRKLLKQNGQDD